MNLGPSESPPKQQARDGHYACHPASTLQRARMALPACPWAWGTQRRHPAPPQQLCPSSWWRVSGGAWGGPTGNGKARGAGQGPGLPCPAGSLSSLLPTQGHPACGTSTFRHNCLQDRRPWALLAEVTTFCAHHDLGPVARLSPGAETLGSSSTAHPPPPAHHRLKD